MLSYTLVNQEDWRYGEQWKVLRTGFSGAENGSPKGGVMYSMKFDNFSPFHLLVVLLMVLGPFSGLLTAADARHPVHYLVFEIGADNIPVPLFHSLVGLSYLPESRSEEEMMGARARIQAGEHSLTFEVWPAAGEPVFHNIVELDRWIRGEYHGEREPDQGWQIENHRFRRERVPFVVRVPQFPGAQLVLEGVTRSVFDLDELAARANSLPLASMAALPSEVAIQEGSGDPGNRADLLIMGDGYTGSTDFNNDATAVAAGFFNVSPYSEYENYVNVLTLFTQSNEAGSDHPPYDPSCTPGDLGCCGDSTAQTDPLAGTYVDTAFDGRFCAANLHRLAVVNVGAALAAAAAVPDWDHILMLLNDTTYGGSGGTLSVTSTHAQAVDIARHEYGHAFTDLADEYDSPFPGYPPCSDITSPA